MECIPKMKEAILLTSGLLLILSGSALAQNVPPPPAPIVESDLRDNNIRMRSVELERIKREARKMRPRESTVAMEMRFAETKKHFEKIQKLQDSIVKAYTTGKTINYSKISKSALKITKNSLRLDENLFGAEPEKNGKDPETKTVERKSVRDLIIELDNSIGIFVKSPIFQNTKVVDSNISKEAQLELRKIMEVSIRLSIEAERMN